MSSDLLTTREAADLLGVGTTSIKRWADQGLLRCVRTPGGHRRIPRDAVTEFLRNREPVADFDNRVAGWTDLLVYGSDPLEVQRRLRAERDACGSWWQTADTLAPVLVEIGRRWETGAITVLQEHLASERLARGLARCGEEISAPVPARSCLLIAAPGDDHTLGLSLAEICLREAGWTTRWSGRRTPIEHIRQFIAAGAVQLVAVSASEYSTDEQLLSELVARLGEACAAAHTELILGGTGHWPPRPRYGKRLSSFCELHHALRALDAAMP